MLCLTGCQNSVLTAVSEPTATLTPMPVEEMADMISANRSYQTAVQVADSAKKMMAATLQLGQNANV